MTAHMSRKRVVLLEFVVIAAQLSSWPCCHLGAESRFMQLTCKCAYLLCIIMLWQARLTGEKTKRNSRTFVLGITKSIYKMDSGTDASLYDPKQFRQALFYVGF
ncbi:PREDICTED: uncharacterized protein LOC108762566 [Trachymyrmex cornetzi]|uniref:uncharacterized protein LOC108762566 n=1 Tax=Trachymyrmex cornetzi TaxID=471704 RepID=UPI00084F561C|nr:PREDICTED: uncharacterized protein LOC108762566 [Trachymyrmex cornetzi]